ncbi:BRO-N domain-containing protein [Aeromonas caviae]|uniref:BRO-N domain-containing protein n=1 Tax=Aeromonas caviae TaxID=648 RepID=UPI0038D0959A
MGGCNFAGSYKSAQNKDTPMFIAKDVAEVLGYSNTAEAVGDHCKKAVPVGNHSKTLGLSSLAKLIPESDVYRLVMR